MTDATSPYLNRRLRTEAEVRAAREPHSPAFCRQVLDGAFEPVYDANGKKIGRLDMAGNFYDLRGNWSENKP